MKESIAIKSESRAKGSERRRSQRARLFGKVTATMNGKPVVKAVCHDVSETGFAFKSKINTLKLDDVLMCEIMTESDLNVFSVKCRVVRIVPVRGAEFIEAYLIGLEFFELSSALKKKIADHVILSPKT